MDKIKSILQKIKTNIEYNQYTPLPKQESELICEYYKSQLTLPIEGQEINIYSPKDTLISVGYSQIIVGDYGAYLEISSDQIIRENIKVKVGQEFRFNSKYKVKYYWYEPIDGSGVKIYLQKRKVNYADYRRGYYYIDPNEMVIK
jgi:hypothetical protein